MTDRLLLSGMLLVNENTELLLLHKKNYNHYETPGGKVEASDFSEKKGEKAALLNCALRELREEIGDSIKISSPKYFGSANFTIPDGRKATAHKFTATIISGKPRIMEPEAFDDYIFIPIKSITEYKLSPDLLILTERIKAYFSKE